MEIETKQKSQEREIDEWSEKSYELSGRRQ